MTELLASILGPYCLLAGLGFNVSTDFYSEMAAKRAEVDKAALYLVGVVLLWLGIPALIHHFTFDGLTETLVTLLVLSIAIKGAVIIVFPKSVMISNFSSPTFFRVAGLASMVLGAYLSYQAFVVL